MTIEVKGRTAALSHDSLNDVPAGAQIRCLRDWMVVEPLPIEHSKVLAVIEDTKPVRGIVKAVGPGLYPIRYNHPDKHKRTKMWYSHVFRPTGVKVGDVVELGSPQDGRGYAFQTLRWGDVTHLLCREEDVSLVDDELWYGCSVGPECRAACNCKGYCALPRPGYFCNKPVGPDGPTEEEINVAESELAEMRIVPQYTLSAPYSIPGIGQSDLDALVGPGLL